MGKDDPSKQLWKELIDMTEYTESIIHEVEALEAERADLDRLITEAVLAEQFTDLLD